MECGVLQITSVGHQVAISIIRTPPPKKKNGPSWGSDVCSKMVNILVFTVFCDQSGLKTVILEQKIEFTSKGSHMLS